MMQDDYAGSVLDHLNLKTFNAMTILFNETSVGGLLIFDPAPRGMQAVVG